MLKLKTTNIKIPAAFYSICALLVVWELACRILVIPDYILPPPSTIIKSVSDVGLTRWLGHAWATLRVCLMGFILAILISIPLSALMAMSPRSRDAIYPILVIIQSTPIVAIAPLIIVILGTDDLPRVVIAFLITFFPIVVSTTTGMMNTPEAYIELSRSTRATRFKEITEIRLPYAVPHIFSGLRVAITLAIVGTVVAEFVAAENGLGYFIQFSTSFFEIPNAFAGLALLLFMSLALFFVVELIQRVFFGWSVDQKR